MKTRNNFTVCYRDERGGHKFGLVQYFLSLQDTTVAVITPLTATTEYCYPIQLRELQHCIVPVKIEPLMVVVPVSSFLFKCVYMDSCDPDVKYVAVPPYVQIYDD